ncbi:hypothetical protein NQ314_009547 [Rhamnusium bicolor]|uniref:Glycolipid transfer protein domain-containing protein n=1 Tax=Rhamnusium bicolor TaxID=1586634 RepID=A0AAV8XYD4_9CUCU|nr:hypothetical protein NQ314_009547 [Rhamnusium bicolor]
MEQEINDKFFDIKIVHDKFQAAVHEDDDVQLLLYLESFEELNKFVTLMGTMFGFVSKDLKAKIDILNEFVRDDNMSENFITVKTMIEYEKQNDLLNKKGHTSGSRTLLRLHRGLDFIQLFLKKLGDLKNEEATSIACRDAYDQTLAKHHPFVCGEIENIQQAMDLLPKTLEATSNVHNRIENLYTLHDIHMLP